MSYVEVFSERLGENVKVYLTERDDISAVSFKGWSDSSWDNSWNDSGRNWDHTWTNLWNHAWDNAWDNSWRDGWRNI